MSAYTLEHASSLYPWGTGHARGSTGTPGGRGGVGNVCCINIIEHFPNSLLPKTYRENGDKFVTWCWSAQGHCMRTVGGQWKPIKSWLFNALSDWSTYSSVFIIMFNLIDVMWNRLWESRSSGGPPILKCLQLSLKQISSTLPMELSKWFLHKPSTSGASEEREGTLQHMCLFMWSAHCWVFY